MIRALNSVAFRLLWLASTVAALGVVTVIWWAMDRDPPIKYLGSPESVAIDPTDVRLSWKVERRRFCDVDVRRWVRDDDGFRFYLPDHYLSAEQVKSIERSDPNLVSLILPIPRGAKRGPMVYVVSMDYYCNPVHSLFPIHVNYSVPFYFGIED